MLKTPQHANVVGENALERFPREARQLAADLIGSARFSRLARISFLGAIERFGGIRTSCKEFTAGSRSEHSIGVAKLIVDLQNPLRLSPGEFKVAIAHALLHDVGHGPFSHSSEYFFSTVFGLDHHRVLTSIVEDESSEISNILRSYGLWFDYRRFILRPSTLPVLASLFYGPINVDTIEGILRSAHFFDIHSQVDSSEIICSLGGRGILVKPLDCFWHLKSKVYNEHIFHADYSLFDRLLSEALFSVQGEVHERDFALCDEQLEERYHYAIQRQLQLSQVARKSKNRRQRVFEINCKIAPTRIPTLSARYIERRGSDAQSDTALPGIYSKEIS